MEGHAALRNESTSEDDADGTRDSGPASRPTRPLHVLLTFITMATLAAVLVRVVMKTRPVRPLLVEESALELWAPAAGGGKPTEYDCDGDGREDCGKWDWGFGLCANLETCGHQYNLSDTNLWQSCRCRRCGDAAPESAFGDEFLRGGLDSKIFQWGTFKNWGDLVESCAIWLMPQNDEQIRQLLVYARQKGYKVRVSGAGHSSGGIVTDGKDNRVVVVSLAEYTAVGEWEFELTEMPDRSARATVNAGWTQLDLYARIRPKNLFLPVITAGYFFQLGGIVANSVHGGNYEAGFINSFVTRMRVMMYDGTIAVIDREEDLRYWRNSYGLLGIILGVELQLERRETIQTYSKSKVLSEWSAEEFWKFIKVDAEANIPLDLVLDGGSAGTQKSFAGEFFVDFLKGGGTKAEILGVLKKTNESVDTSFQPITAPENVADNYGFVMRRTVQDKFGRIPYSVAARRDGAPPVHVGMGPFETRIPVDVNMLLRMLPRRSRLLARMLSHASLNAIPRLLNDIRSLTNDGFILTSTPAASVSAYFMEPSRAFEAMDILRTAQVESYRRANTGEHEGFVWNLPGEFRFIKVADSAVLQPMPPGRWFNAQFLAFPDSAQDDQAWKKAFMMVERQWVEKLGAKHPHMGKLFGFSADGHGRIEPFTDQSLVCGVYSEGQKSAFEAYRAAHDPDGLFAQGLGMSFLAAC